MVTVVNTSTIIIGHCTEVYMAVPRQKENHAEDRAVKIAPPIPSNVHNLEIWDVALAHSQTHHIKASMEHLQ